MNASKHKTRCILKSLVVSLLVSRFLSIMFLASMLGFLAIVFLVSLLVLVVFATLVVSLLAIFLVMLATLVLLALVTATFALLEERVELVVVGCLALDVLVVPVLLLEAVLGLGGSFLVALLLVPALVEALEVAAEAFAALLVLVVVAVLVLLVVLAAPVLAALVGVALFALLPVTLLVMAFVCFLGIKSFAFLEAPLLFETSLVSLLMVSTSSCLQRMGCDHSELLAARRHQRVLLLHRGTGCCGLLGLLHLSSSRCSLLGLGCLLHFLATSSLGRLCVCHRFWRSFRSLSRFLLVAVCRNSRSSGRGPQEQEFRDDSARTEQLGGISGRLCLVGKDRAVLVAQDDRSDLESSSVLVCRRGLGRVSWGGSGGLRYRGRPQRGCGDGASSSGASGGRASRDGASLSVAGLNIVGLSGRLSWLGRLSRDVARNSTGEDREGK